jgi:hypothetical protein
MKDKQISKDIVCGTMNRAADGASLLQERNAECDHAHVSRTTPLRTKMRETMSHSQYQSDAIEPAGEQRTLPSVKQKAFGSYNFLCRIAPHSRQHNFSTRRLKKHG